MINGNMHSNVVTRDRGKYMQCNVINIDTMQFLRKNVQMCTAAVFTFARNTLDVTLTWNLIRHFCQLNMLSATMDNLCINIE